MSQEKPARAGGYYWVRLGGAWAVALYTTETWFSQWDVCGCEMGMYETDIEEFGPRIEPPDDLEKGPEVEEQYTKYSHHGQDVTVRSDLKGTHREHCLCYSCEHFKADDPENNCPIAQAVFDNCVRFGVVTPVWECPKFVEADPV